MFKNTTNIGKNAEKVAQKYLKADGFKILDSNWRTRYCEIDVVASKDKTIYFVEVKYRASAANGDGLDAITPKKLEQMQFSAEMWVNQSRWSGDYQLVVVAACGNPVKISDFIII